MEVADYEKLVNNQKTALQAKVDQVIAEAMGSIETKQCQLLKLIESDPRNPWKFQLDSIKVLASVESSAVQDGPKTEKQQAAKSKETNGPSSRFGNHFKRESTISLEPRGGKVSLDRLTPVSGNKLGRSDFGIRLNPNYPSHPIILPNSGIHLNSGIGLNWRTTGYDPIGKSWGPNCEENFRKHYNEIMTQIKIINDNKK